MPYLTDPAQILAQVANLAQSQCLWLDTEVADYTTKKPRLSLIQVLRWEDWAIAEMPEVLAERVWMLDVLDRPELIQEFIRQVMMNEAIVKVFHNAKYDLRYLGKDQAQNVVCTLERANKIPYYCLPAANKQLKTLVKTLCQLDVCKEQQASDWGQRPLTGEQLHYARLDPVYLAKVDQCLQGIEQTVLPDPETDDLTALSQRHQEIYTQWQQLNSEKEHLEQRLKAAMQAQKTLDLDYCSLKSMTRTTRKVSLMELMQFMTRNQLAIDFPITLTQPMQKQFGKWLQELTTETQQSIVWQLRLKSQEDASDLSERSDGF